MTGVYIPNMEKPRTCSECPMQFGGLCYVAPPEIESTIAETIQELEEMGGKPNWCPLIEIPDELVETWQDYIKKAEMIAKVKAINVPKGE